MSRKEYKGRTECLFRVWETLKRPDSDASHEQVLGNEKPISGVCPLCAAKMKGRNHGKKEDTRYER